MYNMLEVLLKIIIIVGSFWAITRVQTMEDLEMRHRTTLEENIALMADILNDTTPIDTYESFPDQNCVCTTSSHKTTNDGRNVSVMSSIELNCKDGGLPCSFMCIVALRADIRLYDQFLCANLVKCKAAKVTALQNECTMKESEYMTFAMETLSCNYTYRTIDCY